MRLLGEIYWRQFGVLFCSTILLNSSLRAVNVVTSKGSSGALGVIGTETNTPNARSELYSEVLGVRAGCHTLLGRGPANW